MDQTPDSKPLKGIEHIAAYRRLCARFPRICNHIRKGLDNFFEFWIVEGTIIILVGVQPGSVVHSAAAALPFPWLDGIRH